MRSVTLLLSLLLLAPHGPAQHSPAPHSPAPPTNPSDADWQHLRTYIDSQARNVHGDAELFTKLTQPYAPLDLTVTRGDLKSVQSSRDIFYGMAGAAAGISRTALMAHMNTFKRSQDSPSDLATDLTLHLPSLRELAQKFSATAPEVQLIAQWNIDGDLRLNNTFLQASTVTAYLEHNGYIPYPPGVPFHSLDAELSADHLTQADLDATIASMRSLHIVALLKMPLGVRAIYSGVTHNETGLLFLNPGQPPPHTGDRWGNGLQLSTVLSIGPGVYLYEA
jgi:hypothetical protein